MVLPSRKIEKVVVSSAGMVTVRPEPGRHGTDKVFAVIFCSPGCTVPVRGVV